MPEQLYVERIEVDAFLAEGLICEARMDSEAVKIDEDRVGRLRTGYRRRLAVTTKHLVGATAALLCLRFVTAVLIPLTPQEAYYWNYAMHPALSYFDHPPMVALVIGAGYFLLGKSELECG